MREGRILAHSRREVVGEDRCWDVRFVQAVQWNIKSQSFVVSIPVLYNQWNGPCEEEQETALELDKVRQNQPSLHAT